jgi:hypothetical protein
MQTAQIQRAWVGLMQTIRKSTRHYVKRASHSISYSRFVTPFCYKPTRDDNILPKIPHIGLITIAILPRLG